MILFFDRSVGVTIPQALQSITSFPDEVHWHDQQFAHDAADSDWMPVVGAWGWTLIGHDFNWDRNELELGRAPRLQHRRVLPLGRRGLAVGDASLFRCRV